MIRGSPLHYLRFGQGQVNGESSNDDDDDDKYDEERALILPQKRKSEFLSSLYNLPYALVGKRNKN